MRQADGKYGVIEAVSFVVHPQVMYNLTVHDSHTFYVGVGQWLVHNDCGDQASDTSGSSSQQYQQPKYQPTRNIETEINGRLFSGHALDQMQNRGIPLSEVENAIQNGTPTDNSNRGTTVYYDSVNNVSIVTNSVTGNVITVSYEHLH